MYRSYMVVLVARVLIALGVTAVSMTALLAAADAPATRPSALELKDDHGVTVRPFSLEKAKAAVFIFIATECPISNSYAPEINRICEQYRSRGVRFFIVHSEADLSDADAVKHARDFGFSCPVLMDRAHILADRLDATVTPEVAVTDKEGHVLYIGRINDLYLTLGQQRHQATTHELRDALDAVVAGQNVSTAKTRAIGCAIGN